ncbi:MAG TPA: AAA family ATPase [Vicinamibacteria bacterium]|jgi:ATP-dependent Clp protease ATP-binding subunit ClpA
MNLSPGAEAAWMIAAGEAAAGGHALIEPAHLLIGALSLGKLGGGVASGDLNTNAVLVRDENARLLKALSSCGVEATRLRRKARSQLGRGTVQGPPKGPLSRSLTCKAVFAAATDLAGAGQGVGVAHLLAALAEDDVDAVTSRIFRAAGAEQAKLRVALMEAGKGPDVFGAGPAAAALDRAGRDETLERLREMRPRLEQDFGVSIADEALAAAVDLSVRFEPERKLPDKAIELVDKAVERMRPSSTPEGAPTEPLLVTPLTIARVLAERRQLPLDLVAETLDSGMRGRLLALEDYLRQRVLGQDDASGRVARRLRLALSSPPSRPGPRAVLLFVGPSGVGKTETARLLAEHLFGSASGMIRMDMSELREEEALTRLVGSPPGDPAGDREGRLTMALRQKPEALLLLDEVEKAHPRVLEVFLKMFDEGRITDARGRTADAERLVVVMTSNPAAARGSATPNEEELRKVFGVGLLKRIDEVVYFRALDPDDVEMIVGRALADLTSAVERRHSVRVRVTPEAARFAAQQAVQAAPGARGAKRTVERLIHGPLGALVLTGKLTRHTSWVAVYDEGGIYLLPEG